MLSLENIVTEVKHAVAASYSITLRETGSQDIHVPREVYFNRDTACKQLPCPWKGQNLLSAKGFIDATVILCLSISPACAPHASQGSHFLQMQHYPMTASVHVTDDVGGRRLMIKGMRYLRC